MKMYILIPMALLSFASVALTENTPYLLATVLFYNDGKGHQMVCGGRILKKIGDAIRSDIKIRFGDTFVKVVPLFKRYSGTPAASEVAGFVKQRFEHVYVIDIPHWLASAAVQMQSEKLKTDKLEAISMVMRKNEQVVETNSIQQEKLNQPDILSINNVASLPRTFYMPNTVYYAVETKCKTPTAYSCKFKNYRSDERRNFRSYKKRFEMTTPWYKQL